MNEEKLWKNDYLQQSFTYLTEENLDWLEQHCEKTIRITTGNTLKEHLMVLELIKRKKELEKENSVQRKQLNSAFIRGFIHKDKIKEKIAELETKSGGNTYHVQAMINAEKNILKELLEDK